MQTGRLHVELITRIFPNCIYLHSTAKHLKPFSFILIRCSVHILEPQSNLLLLYRSPTASALSPPSHPAPLLSAYSPLQLPTQQPRFVSFTCPTATFLSSPGLCSPHLTSAMPCLALSLDVVSCPNKSWRNW